MQTVQGTDVSQADLDAALDRARAAQRASFYEYLVLSDTWHAVLEQKFGARFEEARQQLRHLAGTPLQEQIRAALQQNGLNPDSIDNQCGIRGKVWNRMRYKVLEPLTQEFFTIEGLPLPEHPASLHA